jgi:hypothetical protein
MFRELWVGQYSSELSYQTISMKLNISSFNVVKWIFEFTKIGICRASQAKAYPSKSSISLCSKNHILVIFLKKSQTFCLASSGQHIVGKFKKQI